MGFITEILRGVRDTADAEAKPQPRSKELIYATNSAGAVHDVEPSAVAAVQEEDLSRSNPQKNRHSQHG